MYHKAVCFVASSGSTVYTRCSLAAVYTAPDSHLCRKLQAHFTIAGTQQSDELYFLASDFCTAVGQLLNPGNVVKSQCSVTVECQSVVGGRSHSVCSLYTALQERAAPPHVHAPNVHLCMTSFTRPSPMLVLQVSNTGVRRPRNEARPSIPTQIFVAGSISTNAEEGLVKTIMCNDVHGCWVIKDATKTQSRTLRKRTRNRPSFPML